MLQKRSRLLDVAAPINGLAVLRGGAATRHNAVTIGRSARDFGSFAPGLPAGRLTAGQVLDLERRRKEVFVSTLAHELRQPLSTLLAAVEVVVGDVSESETATQALDIMKRQIGQMKGLVDDLLDAARWAGGKVTLRTRRLDLRVVIRDAAQDVAAAVAARGHELVVDMPSQPLWVDADPSRLHQVLSNLLRNAVKYTAPGGRIVLAAAQGATSITVRVSDTGCGIETESLTRIFGLFAQVQAADGEGLGIGLSVVRDIVALHGGSIQARSEGLGRGSEFIVTLPLAFPRRTPVRGTRASNRQRAGAAIDARGLCTTGQPEAVRTATMVDAETQPVA